MSADDDFIALADRVMAEQSAAISHVGGASFDAAFWAKLASLGLSRLTASAEASGSEASWFEAGALLASAAHHGVPGPFAENDLLATWVLEQAGATPTDDAVRTFARSKADGTAVAVPWATEVDRVVVLTPTGSGWIVRDLEPAEFEASGEPAQLPGVSTWNLVISAEASTAKALPVPDIVVEELTFRGALARSVQTRGALERVLELCIEHANTRIQFGRKLAKFQMTQEAIANIALEVGMAGCAVDGAVRIAAAGGDHRLATAIARSVTNAATASVVRLAHQVHGAIGATDEHVLPRITGPMLGWRRDFGSPRHWDVLVCDRVAHGDAPTWDQITQLGGVDFHAALA
jgi:acyl-CoA dehydrogenase